MPNHCHNRVTVYSANTHDVAKIKQIFEDEDCFGQIIPEPDWHNTPLMSSDMPKYDWDKPKGKVGELPQYVEDPWRRLVFKSTDQADDRWYDWRVCITEVQSGTHMMYVSQMTTQNVQRLSSTQHGRHPKLYALHLESSILTYPSRGSTTSPAVR